MSALICHCTILVFVVTAKARVPSFLEESPFDTNVARRVKRAYSNLDGVSIRTGVFLRRYPLARILMLCYMVSCLTRRIVGRISSDCLLGSNFCYEVKLFQ